MKKNLFLFSILFSIISCQKEKSTFNDDLLVVKNNDINKLIRNYDNYEKTFIEAIKSKDIGKIKTYSDSANIYDKKLFDKITMEKLSDEEKVKFSEQINNIRKNKIEALSKLNNIK